MVIGRLTLPVLCRLIFDVLSREAFGEENGIVVDLRIPAAGRRHRYLTIRIAERTVFAAPFTVPDISMM